MAKGSRRSLPTAPAAAAVVSDAMIEPRNTPWFQSKDWWMSGTVDDRRPPTRMADVVADGLHLPTRKRGNEHGQVCLAARRGERAGDVLGVTVGRGELQDQHVLGQPAVVARHHRRDAQREALLAEQGVAAVARSV